jgi:hypothetical protein
MPATVEIMPASSLLDRNIAATGFDGGSLSSEAGGRQMAFPRAGWTEEVDDLGAGGEVVLGQGEDPVSVGQGLEGEVEALERLRRREARGLEGDADATVFAADQQPTAFRSSRRSGGALRSPPPSGGHAPGTRCASPQNWGIFKRQFWGGYIRRSHTCVAAPNAASSSVSMSSRTARVACSGGVQSAASTLAQGLRRL